jgi:hypothetical protein
MTRSQKDRALGAVGASLLALLLAACTGRSEQLILEQFFSASRLRDRTALQHVSTITFEPRDQGIVTEFEITGVTSETNGARVSKNVSIRAHVKLPSGQVVERKLAITMQYADQRWTVTGVAMFPSSPRP